MFPTFDVPPQHAETVGARKQRKAKEEEVTRRSSTATSQSSGSNRSVRAESSASGSKKGGFGWFGKSKGVQEIPKVPALKTKISDPSPVPPASSSSAAAAAPSPQETPSPVVTPAAGELVPQVQERRPSQRSNPDLQYQHQQRFHVPPPLQSLPPPPTSALPELPSPGLGSRGTCMKPLLGLILRSANHAIASRIAQQRCLFPSSWETDRCFWRSQRSRVKPAAVLQLTPSQEGSTLGGPSTMLIVLSRRTLHSHTTPTARQRRRRLVQGFQIKASSPSHHADTMISCQRTALMAMTTHPSPRHLPL